MNRPTVMSVQRQIARHIKDCAKNQSDIMVRLRWMEKILYGTLVGTVLSTALSHLIK
jgi:hypothetical protein